MENKLKKVTLFIMSSVLIAWMIIPYNAYAEYYAVYPGSDGFCCPQSDRNNCCSNSCGGYYEFHARRAHADAWATTSEYAWVPDPSDP